MQTKSISIIFGNSLLTTLSVWGLDEWLTLISTLCLIVTTVLGGWFHFKNASLKKAEERLKDAETEKLHLEMELLRQKLKVNDSKELLDN